LEVMGKKGVSGRLVDRFGEEIKWWWEVFQMWSKDAWISCRLILVLEVDRDHTCW
jgi:hypothetical protein